MTVTFQNAGLIEKRAITTFGVNAKENKSPIGYFGTGLKYAIAIILRHGGSVTIWRGLERLDFSLDGFTARDQEFQGVKMNDQELGFTVDLGKNWEVWQAFREIYCNTLDESGTTTTSSLEPSEDTTTIRVSDLPEFDEWYANRGMIVLQTPPIYTGEGAEVHAGLSQFIYYRGIRAMQLEVPSKYTYNIIRPMTLTEDRTLKHSFEAGRAVRDTVMTMRDTELLEEILHSEEGLMENQLNLAVCDERPSDAWLDAAQRVYNRISRPQNPHIPKVLEKYARLERVVHQVELTDIERQQLDRALSLLDKMGYGAIRNQSVVVVENLGHNTLGRVADERIYLSRRVFSMGTKMVAGTLLEELLHIDFSFVDESRDLQNYLIDRLMTMAEQYIWKEPL